MVNPNCAICSEVFDQDAEVMVTRCGHVFHNGCIRDWIQRSQTCPQCRRTDTTLCRVYLNWDPAEPNTTVNELLDGANLHVLETERNLSSAEEEIRILTQAQQQSMDMISELEQKIEDKDGLILSYREASNQVKEEIEMLQTKITSLESLLQICEDNKKDIWNMFEALKIDLKKETEMRKVSEERVVQLESGNSNSDIQSNEDLEALKKKLKSYEDIKNILRGQLEKMHADLCKEAQLRKNSEERLSQLENKLIEAAVGREKEQKASPNIQSTNKLVTDPQTQLLRLAKDKARYVGWKFVWAKDDKVLARKDDTSKVLHIANAGDLLKMV